MYGFLCKRRMSIFGPTITLHTSDPTDVVVISSVTWTQFAYLRNAHTRQRKGGGHQHRGRRAAR